MRTASNQWNQPIGALKLHSFTRPSGGPFTGFKEKCHFMKVVKENDLTFHFLGLHWWFPNPLTCLSRQFYVFVNAQVFTRHDLLLHAQQNLLLWVRVRSIVYPHQSTIQLKYLRFWRKENNGEENIKTATCVMTTLRLEKQINNMIVSEHSDNYHYLHAEKPKHYFYIPEAYMHTII